MVTSLGCKARAPEHRFNTCGAWTELHSLWDLPRSGIRLRSPALAGEFLTTEPPGEPEAVAF